ncbi:PRC-barrel domain-containing protein [Caenispirillum bisanense]|uniref:PRC-barrel domain-containing protein n=1 Tax=Caenispirillum bisanense TaxID=414052 RepID=UPI0031DAED02
MLRTLLLAGAVAVPFAAGPALAQVGTHDAPAPSTRNLPDERIGPDGKSYGQTAAENQPQSVDEIANTNRSEEAVTHMGGAIGARGDATFALPVSELVGDELWYGRDLPAGTVAEVYFGEDGAVQVAIDVRGGDTVLLPLTELEVQTGRGPSDWLLVTPQTREDIAALPAFDPDDEGARRGAGIALSDELTGADVRVGDDDELGEVKDVVVHSQRGLDGVVVDHDGRSVMIPADQLSIGRDGDDVVIVSRLGSQEVATLPEFAFGDVSEEITAPDSPAAEMAREREDAK